MEKIIGGILAFIGIVIAFIFGKGLRNNGVGTKPTDDSYRDSKERIDTIGKGIGNAKSELDKATGILDKIRNRK